MVTSRGGGILREYDEHHPWQYQQATMGTQLLLFLGRPQGSVKRPINHSIFLIRYGSSWVLSKSTSARGWI